MSNTLAKIGAAVGSEVDVTGTVSETHGVSTCRFTL